jgi:branched-chain amino acid transport system permease protein
VPDLTEAESPAVPPSLNRRFDMAPFRSRPVGYGALIALTILIPFVLGDSSTGIVTLILFSVLGVTALNLLQGVAGQLSIGNAAFLAVGALTAGTISDTLGMPAIVSIVAAIVVTTLVGVIVALPALRVTGIFLLIGTIALQFIVSWVGLVYQNHVASIAGFTPSTISIGGHAAGTRSWYFIAAAAAWGASLLMRSLTVGRLGHIGRAWGAIKAGRTLSIAAGVNTARLVIGVFALSSALIGLQGALYTYYVGNASIDTYTLDLALQYVAMLIIGGEGRILGNFLGAGFVVGVPYEVGSYVSNLMPTTAFVRFLQTNLASIQELIYGLALIIFLLIEPRGLAGALTRLRGFTVARIARMRAPRPAHVSVKTAPAANVGAVASPRPVDPAAPASAPASGQPLLDVRAVTVAYNGTAIGVADASLTVCLGEIVGVVGPNGAGKTTLLRAISGFVPGDKAQLLAGRITFGGDDLARLSPSRRVGLGLGSVMERSKVFPSLSVADNLKAVSSRVPHAEYEQNLAYALDLFPVLSQRMRQPAGLLSGGERQMLAFIRAITLRPKLLLIDELSFGLAESLLPVLVEAVRRVNAESGTSVVVVEQNVSLLREIASRCYVLRPGQPAFELPIDDVSDERLMASYLGTDLV